MANVKEQSAAVKSRQTKLSKKTKEELIKIVLRKDQSEINQVRQISKLKEEVNSFYAYERDYIHINISFFDKKKSSYLLAYTFYYYDKYKKKIELLDIDNYIIVVVNDDQGDITYASNKDLTTSTILYI